MDDSKLKEKLADLLIKTENVYHLIYQGKHHQAGLKVIGLKDKICHLLQIMQEEKANEDNRDQPVS